MYFNFFQPVMRLVAKETLPAAKGRSSRVKESVLDECTHGILLTPSEGARREWADRFAAHGLVLLADLRSDLWGENRLEAVEPVVRGVLAGLERGRTASGPAFDALVERLAALFAPFAADLYRRHMATAPTELVVDLERLARGMGHDPTSWRPSHLPHVRDYLPAGKPLALYGRGPNWLYAAVAVHALPAPFYLFDVRLGWTAPPIMDIGSPAQGPLTVRIAREREGGVVQVEFGLPDAYLDIAEVDGETVPLPEAGPCPLPPNRYNIPAFVDPPSPTRTDVAQEHPMTNEMNPKWLADWALETRAVHAGRTAGDRAGGYTPTVPPIHPSVTYSYGRMEDLDEAFATGGYVYTRHGHPTVAALEEAVAALEDGETAVAFASGMAAIHAALLAVGARAGAAIVAARDLYGATYLLLDRLLRSQGVTVRFVDGTDPAEVEAACAEVRPVALLVETVSNPLLKVADLPALAAIAHRHGAALLVDNTFATPYLVRPLALGADVVIHSATKYLGGHGDVLAGVVVTSAARREGLMEVLKTTGANLGPLEAWLLLRGLRTLVLRVERQCASALALARWLETHPRVGRVWYPGLPTHPQHERAARLFGGRGFGGVVTFELKGAGREEVFRFMDRLRLCIPATSLGDIQTLVLYPAHSSHRGLRPEERAALGITDGMVRISVGIEAVEDIRADLEQALSHC